MIQQFPTMFSKYFFVKIKIICIKDWMKFLVTSPEGSWSFLPCICNKPCVTCSKTKHCFKEKQVPKASWVNIKMSITQRAQRLKILNSFLVHYQTNNSVVNGKKFLIVPVFTLLHNIITCTMIVVLLIRVGGIHEIRIRVCNNMNRIRVLNIQIRFFINRCWCC